MDPARLGNTIGVLGVLVLWLWVVCGWVVGGFFVVFLFLFGWCVFGVWLVGVWFVFGRGCPWEPIQALRLLWPCSSFGLCSTLLLHFL